MIGMLLVVVVGKSCRSEKELANDSSIQFPEKLSEYKLLEGSLDQLKPAKGIIHYELSSVLYTDYAYKQRLIKLPKDSLMTVIEGDQLDYPDGTVIAKTFYYQDDERNTQLGKNIIETRILLKERNKWNVAVYLWNKEQNEAYLSQDGSQLDVEWIDTSGDEQKIVYSVPNVQQCIMCHQKNETIKPLGPEIGNLDVELEHKGQKINQLKHWEVEGWLAKNNPEPAITVPDYTDTLVALDKRGRAYLDINCAHCHQPGAMAHNYWINLDLRYETEFEDTRIADAKENILEQMKSGKMPKIGITRPHKEGVELIEKYLKTLED